jgi:branched-chain amino acid aminotransferase
MNGDLFPDDDARVSVFDHGLVVGDGVFETIKVASGVPFAMTRHLDRLRRSAHGLGLPEPDTARWPLSRRQAARRSPGCGSP